VILAEPGAPSRHLSAGRTGGAELQKVHDPDRVLVDPATAIPDAVIPAIVSNPVKAGSLAAVGVSVQGAPGGTPGVTIRGQQGACRPCPRRARSGVRGGPCRADQRLDLS
jgi:hypothetical protein